MNSGIYRLNFANGSSYIGKSVDIIRRLEEHTNSFNRGTAAKKLQNAYILAGPPTSEVILYCHPDHIDLMESVYMILFTPDLNTSLPIKLTQEEIEILNSNTDLLAKSTAQHIIELYQLWDDVDDLELLLGEQNKELEELRAVRTQQELELELGKKYHILSNNMSTLVQNYNLLREEHDTLKEKYNRPWWKKLLRVN